MTLRRWRRKEWGYTWGSNYIKLLPQAVITKSTYPLVLNNTISYNLIASNLFDAEVPAMPAYTRITSDLFDAEVPAMPTYTTVKEVTNIATPIIPTGFTATPVMTTTG